jgi:hypothetical protein
VGGYPSVKERDPRGDPRGESAPPLRYLVEWTGHAGQTDWVDDIHVTPLGVASFLKKILSDDEFAAHWEGVLILEDPRLRNQATLTGMRCVCVRACERVCVRVCVVRARQRKGKH